jgi:hypothetical protein
MITTLLAVALMIALASGAIAGLALKKAKGALKGVEAVIAVIALDQDTPMSPRPGRPARAVARVSRDLPRPDSLRLMQGGAA